MMLRRLIHTSPKTFFEPLSTPIRIPDPQLVDHKPSIKVSTVGNGVRVASYDAKVPLTSISVLINSGSRIETFKESGISQTVKNLIYCSTPNRLRIRIARELEGLGAFVRSSVDREYLMYSATTTRDSLGEILPVLGDIAQPRALEWEVRYAKRDFLPTDADHFENDRRLLLADALHAEAYRNTGLGNPQFLTHEQISSIDADGVNDFIERYHTADRMVVVGSGIDHNELVTMVDNSFDHIPAGSANPSSPSRYIGGDVRIRKDGTTHIAIAFEGASMANTKELVALGTLQYLLGGSTISDGPLLSVLSERSLDRILWPNQYQPNADPYYTVHPGSASRLGSLLQTPSLGLHHLSAFCVPHSDSGLFGIYAVAEPGNNRSIIEAVTHQLKEIASGKVQEKELFGARQAFLVATLEQLDNSPSRAEFIGKQLLLGKSSALSPIDFASAINSLTLGDVLSVAKKVLKSQPTVVVVGDPQNIPTQQEIAKSLQ